MARGVGTIIHMITATTTIMRTIIHTRAVQIQRTGFRVMCTAPAAIMVRNMVTTTAMKRQRPRRTRRMASLVMFTDRAASIERLI